MTRHQVSGERTTVDESVVDGIRVAVITPPGSVGTCIAVMGFGAWLDPFEVQRFARISEQWSIRVVVPEAPGLGRTPSSLRWSERAALTVGSYAPLARRMLAAAQHVTGDDEQPHVLGYSLGASIVTAMLAAPDARRAATLTLIEPVAMRRRSPFRLLSNVRTEDAAIDVYLGETAADPQNVAPSDRTPGASRPHRGAVDQLLLSTALCWGRLRSDLAVIGRRIPSTRLLLLNGDESVLSPTGQVTQLAAVTRQAGLPVTQVEVKGGHGLWQSMPRVDDLARHVSSFWGDP